MDTSFETKFVCCCCMGCCIFPGWTMRRIEAIRQHRQSIRAYDTRPISEIIDSENRAEPDQAFPDIPAPVDQRLRIQRGRVFLCPSTTEALTHVVKVTAKNDLKAVADGTTTD